MIEVGESEPVEGESAMNSEYNGIDELQLTTDALKENNVLHAWERMLKQEEDAADRDLIGRALSAGVPEGWKLVPAEPTNEMLRAGYRHIAEEITIGRDDKGGRIRGINPELWRVMLAAAPQPEQGEPSMPTHRCAGCGEYLHERQVHDNEWHETAVEINSELEPQPCGPVHRMNDDPTPTPDGGNDCPKCGGSGRIPVVDFGAEDGGMSRATCPLCTASDGPDEPDGPWAAGWEQRTPDGGEGALGSLRRIWDHADGVSTGPPDSRDYERVRRALREPRVPAPTDNGIPGLDSLCEQYNDGEIDLCALVCRAWNKALAHRGTQEGEQWNFC